MGVDDLVRVVKTNAIIILSDSSPKAGCIASCRGRGRLQIPGALVLRILRSIPVVDLIVCSEHRTQQFCVFFCCQPSKFGRITFATNRCRYLTPFGNPRDVSGDIFWNSCRGTFFFSNFGRTKRLTFYRICFFFRLRGRLAFCFVGFISVLNTFRKISCERCVVQVPPRGRRAARVTSYQGTRYLLRGTTGYRVPFKGNDRVLDTF